MTFSESSSPAVDRSDEVRNTELRHTEGIAALERIEVELAAVEQAMARLDAGSYGRCEVCRGSIGDDLLAADPTVSVCSGHLPVLGGDLDRGRATTAPA